MPYGVPDATWRMLPPEDQEAVKAGWAASQVSQVAPAAPSGPTQAEIDAANVAGAAAAAAANALLAGQGSAGIAAAAAAAGATPEVVQALAESGVPDVTHVTVTSSSAGASSSGGGGASGPGGAGAIDFGSVDEAAVTRELYAAGVIDRNDPGGGESRLPSTAWGDFRDYFAKDQPFLGAHIRNQGRQLRSVVASDLWSPST